MVRAGPLYASLLLWVGVCTSMLARADAALPEEPPDAVATRLEGVSAIVEDALARRELPGCVIAIGTGERVLYLRAFGERTLGEPMSVDTLFDLASLTKPIATASSVALLVERGVLALDQPAARTLPALAHGDGRAITVRELLLHTSGLPAVSPLSDMERGRAEALARIAGLRRHAAPGAHFEYSDLGYVLLGEVVARAAGEPLERFSARSLFEPLGMVDTRFGVRVADIPRTAPTETRDGQPIRGIVDDPRAYRLGGVAGNAGLFATAGDLARFAQMLLRGGELAGTRVLSEARVRALTKVVPAGSAQRTLGWDAKSSYAHGRGTLLSERAFGHGGYTGTSLWIDPAHDLFVILLSNRVHVGARGTIHPLASSVADLATRALAPKPTRVQTGIDVLHDEAYARLRGRTVALLTHEAARDGAGVRTLDRLLAAPRVRVSAILTPEHGLSGKHEGKVRDQRHRGLPVHSLFGATRRPSAAMLGSADAIVIDLVDVGTRFYTYMATVLATLEVAAELDLPVFLLDRPNPLDGTHVEGPVSEPAFASFVNYHPLPLRHGMTAGELARFLCRARGLRTRLHVVRIEGWQRSDWAGALPARWDAPSPNLGSKEQALLYPAIGLVEGTNVSVGRGTSRAFRVVGAPFVDAASLAQAVRAEALPGVTVRTTRFRPAVGPHARRSVPGIELRVRDARVFSAARTGLALIRALHAQARGWDDTRLERLVAHRDTLALLGRGSTLDAIVASWADDLTRFERARAEVLLY